MNLSLGAQVEWTYIVGVDKKIMRRAGEVVEIVEPQSLPATKLKNPTKVVRDHRSYVVKVRTEKETLYFWPLVQALEVLPTCEITKKAIAKAQQSKPPLDLGNPDNPSTTAQATSPAAKFQPHEVEESEWDDGIAPAVLKKSPTVRALELLSADSLSSPVSAPKANTRLEKQVENWSQFLSPPKTKEEIFRYAFIALVDAHLENKLLFDATFGKGTLFAHVPLEDRLESLRRFNIKEADAERAIEKALALID